jgi:apolipoprotein N-acyltransferase
MLVGADLGAGPGRYKVTSLEISAKGRIVGVYQKTHLVPYGEYAPFRSELSWLSLLNQIPEDAIAARHGKVVPIAGGVVAPVLSFEDDFASLVQRRIHLGGRLLAVGTNTSTWGRSWASAQHVAMSQVNAACNGVWAVHASLTGISAFIDPSGRVVSEAPLYEATTLVHDVTFARDVTFYARHGDWAAYGCLVISAALLLISLISARKRPGNVASP